MGVKVMILLVLFLYFGSIQCFHSLLQPTEDYEEKYFVQYIDHFNYGGQAGPNGQYQQRYLITEKYWNTGVGPILFYTGNEGDIINFWVNTGFLFELAQKFDALVIFAEHRYYGKSLPFGNNSFTNENIGFLNIEQTLADYAVLLKFIKKQMKATKCSVFSFGGSYGGLLTGYMRYKYPHIIDGGVASSAPFFDVAGSRPRNEFFQAVTATFLKADSTCPDSVKEGFSALMKLFSSGSSGIEKIEQTFRLCPGQFKKQFVEKNVLAWARNAFTMLAMMDYPYPTKFMADLPGHPVNLACQYMQGNDKLVGLGKITDLLYGSKVDCHDSYQEYVSCSDPTGCGTGPDSWPWDYQACTEMLLPGGSNNVTDMFPLLEFTLEMRKHYCSGRWGLGFSRLDWLATNFFNTTEDIKKTSRLIFPNGDLDPWMPGGVLESLSDSLIAIMVEGGAHHLDLRASNPADPQSVRDAREQITTYLSQWLEEDRIRYYDNEAPNRT